MRIVPLSAAGLTGYLIPLITAPLTAASIASRENLIASILQPSLHSNQDTETETSESELPL